jgi:hypothetical protein
MGYKSRGVAHGAVVGGGYGTTWPWPDLGGGVV